MKTKLKSKLKSNKLDSKIKNIAQGSLEYLLLIGGAVLVAVIVIVLLTSMTGSSSESTKNASEKAEGSYDILKGLANDSTTQPVSPVQQPVCDLSNPELCTTQSACTGIPELNWCTNICQASACPPTQTEVPLGNVIGTKGSLIDFDNSETTKIGFNSATNKIQLKLSEVNLTSSNQTTYSDKPSLIFRDLLKGTNTTTPSLLDNTKGATTNDSIILFSRNDKTTSLKMSSTNFGL